MDIKVKSEGPIYVTRKAHLPGVSTTEQLMGTFFLDDIQPDTEFKEQFQTFKLE